MIIIVVSNSYIIVHASFPIHIVIYVVINVIDNSGIVNNPCIIVTY